MSRTNITTPPYVLLNCVRVKRFIAFISAFAIICSSLSCTDTGFDAKRKERQQSSATPDGSGGLSIIKERLHGKTTARLNYAKTHELLLLVARGHKPDSSGHRSTEVGYVPISYSAIISENNRQRNIQFFGRCESCVFDHKVLDFDTATSQAISNLIDPDHLWVY